MNDSSVLMSDVGAFGWAGFSPQLFSTFFIYCSFVVAVV
jgi:hypothetical protein